MLDFQDNYRSYIVLRPEGSGIVIYEDDQRLGYFNQTQQTFRKHSNGLFYTGDALDGGPPGNWWMELTRN